MKDFIRFGLFPLTLFGGLSLMLMARYMGVSMELTALLVAVATMAIVYGAERSLPFRPDWNRGDGDVATDMLSLAVILALLEPLIKLLSLWIGARILLLVGDQNPVDVFPSHWPLLMQLFLFAAAAEFGRYWMHRLSHTNAWLWRFHAQHHSPERLYQFNGYRIHPLNYAWNYFFGQFPLLLLGATSEVVWLYFTLSAIVAAFQHANIDSRNGPLNWIFSTNELHRWHHSTDSRIGYKNHGSVLIIWDLVFGSYYSGKTAKLDKVGIVSPRHYPRNNYFKQLLAPFCWQRCTR